MNFNYTHNYHTLNFFECPSFEQLAVIAKEFYVVRSTSANGLYAIVPELTGNGKVNTSI